MVSITRGDFEFLFHDYTSLEAQGLVPEDPREEGRVVAVYGCSVPSPRRRDDHRLRGWVGATERLFGKSWDKGKRFRAMETYCAANAGTFCFARPICADGSAQPTLLELGVLRRPRNLWVETFDNR